MSDAVSVTVSWLNPPKRCIRCDTVEGVAPEDSRTEYVYDGTPGSDDDPNKPVMLCRACAAEHHQYWDERWADYYSGLL